MSFLVTYTWSRPAGTYLNGIYFPIICDTRDTFTMSTLATNVPTFYPHPENTKKKHTHIMVTTELTKIRSLNMVF